MDTTRPGNVIVLFDGTCGLCHGLVRFLLARDPEGLFRFAPLASATARNLVGAQASAEDTVVVLEEGKAYVRSEAVLRLARHLPAPWSWAAATRFIPRPLRDLVYRLVARYRFRIFGRLRTCPVPGPGVRDRFLDLGPRPPT